MAKVLDATTALARAFAVFAATSLLLQPIRLAAAEADQPAATPEKPPAKSDSPVASGDTDKPKEKSARQVVQRKDGAVTLHAKDATVHGDKIRYEPDKDTIGYWTSATDTVSWDLKITDPGEFALIVEQGCGQGQGGSEYTIEIGDQKLSDRVQDTGSFATFRVRRLGTIKLDKPGDYTLTVTPTNKAAKAVMDLRTVWLKPPALEKAIAIPPLKFDSPRKD